MATPWAWQPDALLLRHWVPINAARTSSTDVEFDCCLDVFLMLPTGKNMASC